MKKNVKLIMTILALLVFHNMQAEWKRDSVTTLPYVNATCLINNNVRFALQDEYIYKTEDAGLTWQKEQVFAKSVDYYITHQSITFLDDKTGFIQYRVTNYIAVDSIYVYKTNDCGKHWEMQAITYGDASEKIKFISELNWVSYNNKAIRVSADGGISWQKKDLNNADTIIHTVEIMGDNEWYAFSGNVNADIVTVCVSHDKGNKWKNIATLKLYGKDSLFKFIMPFYVGMAKTPKGLVILYNIYYPGCGMFYDHSMIYNLERDYHNQWAVKATKFNFNYSPPSGIFYRNDTGYIVTDNRIYKSIGVGHDWFPTLEIENYKQGNFMGVGVVDGVFIAYTSKAAMFRNEDPNSDRNMAVQQTANTGSNVAVFPNPASDKLTFRLADKDILKCTISIIDMNGKTVFEESYSSTGEITINTGLLAVGIYTYGITNNKKTVYGKITIRQ